MRVALNAAHRGRLPNRPRCVHAVDHSGHTILFVVCAALGVCLRISMERGRDQIIRGRSWQQIAGHPIEVVNVGSVGAKVEEILTGRAEAYLHNTGFYEWDLAAPMGVAQHYGLVIELWDGSSIALNRMPPYVRDVLVVRPELADGLREAIRS